MFMQETYYKMSQKSLSRRFHYLKERKVTIRDILLFVWNVWMEKKVVEGVSFVIWDVLHRFRMLKFITFTDYAPIEPNSTWNNVSNRRTNQFSFKISKSPFCWKLLFFDNTGAAYGCQYTSPFDLYIMSLGKKPSKRYQFPKEIISIFISSKKIILVCLTDGSIYRSINRGLTFSITLNLSTNESYFRFDYGITETFDNTLIIGEYGNVTKAQRWRPLAYIYFSENGGETWEHSDFLIKQGVNKHIHLIRYSKRINSIILTDGDNKKQIWIGSSLKQSQVSNNVRWQLCNNHHIQTGGYASMVEIGSKFLFGTDYQGGTNFIIESKDCKCFVKYAIPEPYRRCPIMGMTKRYSKRGVEIWATLYNTTDSKVKSLLMFTDDNGESWTKVIEYNGTKNLIHLVSTANTNPNEVYFCVTLLSHTGTETPVVTYRITD